jgi:hypothetical protein
MVLLSMAVPPEGRGEFRERFRAMAMEEKKPCYIGCGVVCNTPVSCWIASAYHCDHRF